MPPTRSPKKRGSSKAKSKISPKKRRSKPRAPKTKKRAPKRAPVKKRAPKKTAKKQTRKSVVRSQKKRAPKKTAAKTARSKAAAKGWRTRRKKARLLDAMADVRMQNADPQVLPPGWVETRGKLIYRDGKLFRQVVHTWDQKAFDQVRFDILEQLNIDFATKEELDDYLRWLASELQIDISDMYRMYFGYSIEGQFAAAS